LTSDSVDGVRTRQRQYATPAIHAQTTFGRETFRYCASKELIDLPSNISTNLCLRRFTAQVHELLTLSQIAEFCLFPVDQFCDLSCIDDVVTSLRDPVLSE
jgi:hypothetical protein